MAIIVGFISFVLGVFAGMVIVGMVKGKEILKKND